MSINPLSHVSQIWSRATTALTQTPDVGSAMCRSSAASGKGSHSQAAGTVSLSDHASTPFATLASNLQSVLLQLQAGQTQPGQAPQGPGNPYGGQAPATTGSLSTTV